MTVQIDDAGYGSLLGGVVIGIYRKETGEFTHGVVPVKLFQEKDYDNDAYLVDVCRVVEECLQRLHFHHEPVELCTGNIFNDLRSWLTERGYHWQGVKITGPLQNLVEEAYGDYLNNLGVPQSLTGNMTDYAKLHLKLLRWVMAGFDVRYPLCKSGRDSVAMLLKTGVNYKTVQAVTKDHLCMRCGGTIYEGESAVQGQFKFKDKYLRFYRHGRCPEDDKENSLI